MEEIPRGPKRVAIFIGLLTLGLFILSLLQGCGTSTRYDDEASTMHVIRLNEDESGELRNILEELDGYSYYLYGKSHNIDHALGTLYCYFEGDDEVCEKVSQSEAQLAFEVIQGVVIDRTAYVKRLHEILGI